MNRDEAKFILGAYRPDGEDAEDPQFRKALELARQDPALGAWFAEQQAVDRAFSMRIRQAPVPPSLKNDLLLARTTAGRRSRRRYPMWLAAAAAVALLLAGAGWQIRRSAEASARFAMFHEAMAATYAMVTPQTDQRMWLDDAGTRGWIGERGGDTGYAVPPALAAQGIATCKVLDWEGHTVTLLCFDLAGGHASIFIVDSEDLPGTSFGTDPAYASAGGQTTATWRSNGRIYHLISDMSETQLKALL